MPRAAAPRRSLAKAGARCARREARPSGRGGAPSARGTALGPVATIWAWQGGVLPLQAVGRGRRGARLLDDDRGRSHEDLSEDLRDAWERLRESAVALGDQRIYASHNSIMFSRKSCYFFVRPKKSFLEVCVFLGRTMKAPQVRRADRASKTKVVHFIHVGSPGRSGTAPHRLAAGSVRTVGCADLEGRGDTSQVEAETRTEEETESQGHAQTAAARKSKRR